MLSTPVGRFRVIAFVEGLSFLVLLFIAMPIKYIGENPDPVKYTGWVHGMIDGLPAFPDEVPEPGWKELRIGFASGMPAASSRTTNRLKRSRRPRSSPTR